MAMTESTQYQEVAAMIDGADEHADRADGVGDHLEVGAAQVEALLGAGLQQPEADRLMSRPRMATTIIGVVETSGVSWRRWMAS